MNDDNIILHHNTVMNSFKTEHIEDTILELETKIATLEKLISRCDLISPKNIQRELDILREELEQLKTREDKYFYILQSTPLIEDYKKELEKPVQLNFMGKPIQPDTLIRDEICEKFYQILDLSSIPIEDGSMSIPKPRKKSSTTPKQLSKAESPSDLLVSKCENCLSVNLVREDKLIVCEECGCEQENSHFSMGYTDIDRINITTKYTYDRRIHFRDCINQYQAYRFRGIFDTIIYIFQEYIK